MKKKYLSREIEIIDSSGELRTFRMSIAEVEYSSDGKDILSIAVRDFINEEPGVEYSDTPLRFEMH